MSQDERVHGTHGDDNVTTVCAECGYRQLCENLGYDLDCVYEDECSIYDSFLESEEADEFID